MVQHACRSSGSWLAQFGETQDIKLRVESRLFTACSLLPSTSVLVRLPCVVQLLLHSGSVHPALTRTRVVAFRSRRHPHSSVSARTTSSLYRRISFSAPPSSLPSPHQFSPHQRSNIIFFSHTTFTFTPTFDAHHLLSSSRHSTSTASTLSPPPHTHYHTTHTRLNVLRFFFVVEPSGHR